MTTSVLTKLNGWSKVIATLLAVAAAYISIATKLDRATETAAATTMQLMQLRVDMAEVDNKVDDVGERLANVEGQLEAARRR